MAGAWPGLVGGSGGSSVTSSALLTGHCLLKLLMSGVPEPLVFPESMSNRWDFALDNRAEHALEGHKTSSWVMQEFFYVLGPGEEAVLVAMAEGA